MSNVRAFFVKLGERAEAVAQRLFHTLKATGGEHGHALVEAIEAEMQKTGGELAGDYAAQMVDALAGLPTESEVVRALDTHTLRHFGADAQKELIARLQCRIQGLNPDEPLHPGAQSTAPTTQPVDANGAPV